MRYEPNFPVEDLMPAPWNARGDIDDASLRELAESIKSQGVLSPILARPLDGGDAEIVAGHRRTRAAELAGLKTVPVRLMDADDDEARTLAITENLQRADLHPLDEARGFAELGARGVPLQKVAAKVGKSVAYVAGRMALMNLIPPAATYYRAGVILLGHAQLLAKLQPADQTKALVHCVGTAEASSSEDLEDLRRTMRVATVDDLGRFLRAQVLRDLSRAIWPIKTFRLEGGVACTGCPMRGGLNLGLFEAEDDEDDGGGEGYCHNGACYSDKQDAWLEEIGARAAEDAGLALVKVAAGGGKAPKGVLKEAAYTELKTTAKATACDDTRMAVVVAVDRYGYYGPSRAKLGDTFPVCTAKECKKHGRTVESKKAKASRESGGDGEDYETQRQREEAKSKARGKAKEALRLQLIARATWPLPETLIARLLSDLAEQCGDGIDTLPTCAPETALARLLVAYLVEGELGGWAGDTEAFQACCTALDVPFDFACEAE